MKWSLCIDQLELIGSHDCCELMLRSHARNGAMLEQCSALAWRSDDTMGAYEVSVEKKKSRSGRDHSPARRRWGGDTQGEEEGRGVGYTLLRNSPPVGCSGVLHSEEFLALSLLLFGSLSLIMSYWRQKRAITPGGEMVGIHDRTNLGIVIV